MAKANPGVDWGHIFITFIQPQNHPLGIHYTCVTSIHTRNPISSEYTRGVNASASLSLASGLVLWPRFLLLHAAVVGTPHSTTPPFVQSH